MIFVSVTLPFRFLVAPALCVVGVGGRRLSTGWSIRDKEFFAALYALRQCSIWLGPAPVTILTDHESNLAATAVEMDPSAGG